ncbi:MAG TPA: glycosyltransferase family 2 protein [Blastocatellia bacterium]
MPKVSVIIPTYNRSHLLPRAVASARTAGTDMEIVVVDNGCTDDTAKVCEQLPDIRYVRLDRNAGPGGGRNAGIEASSGPYIAFLDDDDMRLPGSLDLQVEALEADPGASFIYGKALRADENCVPVGMVDPDECPQGDIFWWLLKLPTIPCVSVVVRRTSLATTGLFDQTLACADDWDLWIRLAERFRVLASPAPVGIYRAASTAANNTTSNFALAYKTAISIQTRGLQLERAKAAPWRLRRSTRRHLLNRASDVLIWTAADALENGLWEIGRASILEAIRLNPSRALRLWTLKLLSRSLVSRGRANSASGSIINPL